MNEMDLALLLDKEYVEDAIKLMNFYLKHIDFTEEQRINTYFRLGVCYAHMRWDKDAFDYFDMILALRPNDAEVLTQKALIYMSENDFDAALEQLQLAVDHEPERNYLYRTMGILSLLKKRYDDFKRYSALSDEPLTQYEIDEAIYMVESGDEVSINVLMESMRNNLSY